MPPVNFAVNRANLAEIILEKIASPLIYLWEKWQLLTAEEKLPYATPEYKKVLENAIKIGKEVASQIGEVKAVESRNQTEKETQNMD